MHAVEQEHIGMPSRPEHDFGACCTTSTEAMRSTVFRAAIRFRFDDAPDKVLIAMTEHQ
jgi:hypothetical protein